MEDMKYPDAWKNAFDDWWHRAGRYLDPDTSDVPWYDKRKSMAELAFNAAIAFSRNYIADTEAIPSKLLFANGRTVNICDDCLDVGINPQQQDKRHD